jgi:hypothetical protein
VPTILFLHVQKFSTNSTNGIRLKIIDYSYFV